MRNLVIAVFLLGLLAPGFAFVIGMRAEAFENRAFTRWPDLSLRTVSDATYFRDVGQYLVHHLPLRQYAVSARHHTLTGLFGAVATERVVIGSDGFLFLRASLENWCNGSPLDWTAKQSGRAMRDVSAHKRVIYVSVPDKHQIYPDKMPSPFVPLLTCATENRERFVASLNRFLGDDFIDMKPTLEAMRREPSTDELYFETDTHWRSPGADAMIRMILGHLGKSIDQNEFEYRPVDGNKADLAIQLGTTEAKASMRLVAARPEIVATERRQIEINGRQPIRIHSNVGPVDQLIPGKTLVLYDSYMIPALDALPMYFEHVTLIHWADITPARMRKYAFDADLIVAESIDRLAPFRHRRHVARWWRKSIAEMGS